MYIYKHKSYIIPDFNVRSCNKQSCYDIIQGSSIIVSTNNQRNCRTGAFSGTGGGWADYLIYYVMRLMPHMQMTLVFLSTSSTSSRTIFILRTFTRPLKPYNALHKERYHYSIELSTKLLVLLSTLQKTLQYLTASSSAVSPSNKLWEFTLALLLKRRSMMSLECDCVRRVARCKGVNPF